MSYQPPPEGPPPAPGPSKIRRILGGPVLGAIVAWLVVGLGRTWIETRGAVYFVGGTARTALVRFRDERGRREEHHVRLPWTSRNVVVTRGTGVSVDAVPLDNGSVDCRINFDANLLVERPGSDVGVLCAGFAP